MSRFKITRMTKKETKMVEMEIRKALPNSLSYSEKCAILERLAEEYRQKSRKDVYGDQKFKGKNIDYSPILPKEK